MPSTLTVAVNTAFLRSVGGMLTFAEMACGVVAFAMAEGYGGFNMREFVALISFTYWLISFYILLSGLLSLTGTVLPTTFFFLLFHALGFPLYLAGGIGALTTISWHSDYYTYGYYGYGRAQMITAGVFGLVASVCHLVHTIFVYKGR
ncbi:uncharacterized protein LOC135378274 [Ornithodoros turicata]|uniref:uncharacterized protein LOC135378274 n=1 Tax=Ornithodoros turicata TaxID=34597 RepID=UPI00313918A7